MPFPEPLSPALWARILDYACQDDGTTGLSLSSTSRDVRTLSASHRYQSIQINGWKELLAFEQHFAKLPKEHQGIVNLYVKLPSVFEAGYPNHAMWEQESDDESYIYPEDSDESSDGSDTEDEAEDPDPQEPSEENIHYLLKEYPSETDDATGIRIESDLRPRFQAEGHLYTTLRRILDACSHSLEFFALQWMPLAASQCGATFILPDSLPKLKSFAVWQECPELYQPSFNSWEKCIAQELEKKIVAIPSLERLEMNVPVVGNWPQYLPLESTPLRYVTAPCVSVKRLHDAGARRIRVFCECRHCYPVEWPVSRRSMRTDYIDFKRNWAEQVINDSTNVDFDWGDPTPSVSEDSSPPTPEPTKRAKPVSVQRPMPPLSEFDLLVKEIMTEVFRKADEELDEVPLAIEVDDEEEGNQTDPTPAPLEIRETAGSQETSFAVILFTWLEDRKEADYIDAALIADENGCIRLDDHAERLSPRGFQKTEKLEIYEFDHERWSPMADGQVLGPFPSGRVVLLRREGVKAMKRFNTFLDLANHINTRVDPSM